MDQIDPSHDLKQFAKDMVRAAVAWRCHVDFAWVGFEIAFGGRVDEEVARPHPSQTRMCRFPASGSSWESLARGGVPMDNSRRWQRAALEECSEPAPVEPAPAIPPRQPFLPNPRDLVGVPA